jgi:hypothetical protein
VRQELTWEQASPQRGEDTWFSAIELTMNLNLDFINFLLYLLKLLGAVSGSKSND